MSTPLQAQIKRFDLDLPLPEKKTNQAAAFDLSCRIDIIIPAQTSALLPLNVAIKPPEGYWTLLACRSSLPKRGLLPANGIGIIDPDFSGPDNEYHLFVFNFSKSEVVIKRGERIAQISFLPLTSIDFVEMKQLEGMNRGSFGSTGL